MSLDSQPRFDGMSDRSSRAASAMVDSPILGGVHRADRGCPERFARSRRDQDAWIRSHARRISLGVGS